MSSRPRPAPRDVGQRPCSGPPPDAQTRQSPVHTTRPHRPQVGGGGSSSAALRSSSVMIRATRSDEGRASSSLSRSCAGLVRCSSRCSATTATAGPRTRGSRGRWSSPVTCTRPASRGTSLRALSVSPRGTRSQPADRARPGGTGRRSDSPPRDGRRRNVASTSLGTRLPAHLRLMTRTCHARGGSTRSKVNLIPMPEPVELGFRARGLAPPSMDGCSSRHEPWLVTVVTN